MDTGITHISTTIDKAASYLRVVTKHGEAVMMLGLPGIGNAGRNSSSPAPSEPDLLHHRRPARPARHYSAFPMARTTPRLAG